MVRVKRGRVARHYRKKVFSLTKSTIGSNLYLFRIAKQHAIKAIKYAYAGRRARKRQYRSSWIVRLNAKVRIHGWNYSLFLYYLRKKNCLLNRKILALPVMINNPFKLYCIYLAISIIFSRVVSHVQLISRKDSKLILPTTLFFVVSYKNINLLRQYIGITGKIFPRRITRLTSKEHRAVSKSIRQARRVGLLPFVWLTA